MYNNYYRNCNRYYGDNHQIMVIIILGFSYPTVFNTRSLEVMFKVTFVFWKHDFIYLYDGREMSQKLKQSRETHQGIRSWSSNTERFLNFDSIHRLCNEENLIKYNSTVTNSHRPTSLYQISQNTLKKVTPIFKVFMLLFFRQCS